ncbi:MAG: radical SAM protein [Deltaproteobacteria bacterium]|nr:radical SAM protein [Deltaproteobacteria bacterium]
MKEFSPFKALHHLAAIGKIIDGDAPAPITVELDPTNYCNHNCLWCIDQRLHTDNAAGLNLDLCLKLADSLRAMGVKAVTIKGGGEPLTHPRINEILEYYHSSGIEIGLITNGELLAEHLEAIRKYCAWVRVSVDAATAETHARIHRPKSPGAFDRVCEGIRALAGNILIGAVMVIHSINCHEMPTAAGMIRNLGCQYVAFKRAIVPLEVFKLELLESMDQMYRKVKVKMENSNFTVMGEHLYNFKKNWRPLPYNLCKAHQLIGIVCADGLVYACCSTRGNERYCFGSLYENTFEDIWRSEKRRRVLEDIDSGSCRQTCLGRTSFLRYDHYNALIGYLAGGEFPHKNFL